MRRSRLVVAAFLAFQLALPARGLFLRWSGGPVSSDFAWQMYSVAP